MPRNPDDPFDLQGKNLRRVVTQIRKNIRIQRMRVASHIVTLLILLTVGILGCRTTGIFLGIGFVCLVMAPFSLLGVFADRHLLRWQQQRLAECAHRLNGAEDFGGS